MSAAEQQPLNAVKADTSACCIDCYDAPCECHTRNHLLVERLKAELAASESLVTALQEQMARLAEQHAKAVAEAREGQREACAQAVSNYPQIFGHKTADEIVRATPLNATPLADRIAELEAVVGREQAAYVEERTRGLESALTAEVERHQATAKALDAEREHCRFARDRLHEEENESRFLRSQVENSRTVVADLRAALEDLIYKPPEVSKDRDGLANRIRAALDASLPAGPREVR